MLRHGVLRFVWIAALGPAAGAVYVLLAPKPLGGLAWLGLLAAGLGLALLDLAVGGPRRMVADFRAGRYDAAERGAVVLLRLTRRPARRAALELHRAACRLAAGRHQDGLDLMTRMDPSVLPESLRAIWLNNTAYGTLFTGGSAERALTLCNQAATLEPTNPAIRSTRGVALLSLGRIEDAIAELQTSVDSGLKKQGPAALAENYYHLARAWEKKGELAYARDHYLKSVNIGPLTPFGRKSAERVLGDMPGSWSGQ